MARKKQLSIFLSESLKEMLWVSCPILPHSQIILHILTFIRRWHFASRLHRSELCDRLLPRTQIVMLEETDCIEEQIIHELKVLFSELLWLVVQIESVSIQSESPEVEEKSAY